MLTRSGVLCLPDNATAPSLEDLALGLAAQPRFSGQALRPWNVAQHSLVVSKLMEALDPSLVFDALLHDAAEAILGDTPSLWKTVDRRCLEADLDTRIYRRLRRKLPSLAAHRLIKECDQVSVLAEAKIVATRETFNYISKSQDGAGPTEAALAAVQAVLSFGPEMSAARWLFRANQLCAAVTTPLQRAAKVGGR